MKNNSAFKILFWSLTGLFSLLFVTIFTAMTISIAFDPYSEKIVILFPIIAAIVIFLIIFFIARFVYKDASQHDMDPWLWMTISVYVPNLIGIIIYLIVRSNNTFSDKICIHCGKHIKRDFKVCPYCSAELTNKCPNCGSEIMADWNVCPKCGKSL